MIDWFFWLIKLPAMLIGGVILWWAVMCLAIGVFKYLAKVGR